MDPALSPDPTVAAEASDAETLAVEFEGNTYQVPPSVDDWSIAATQALELGRTITFLEGVLGRKQWQRFTRRHATTRDAGLMVTAVIQAYGADSGE